MGVVENSEGFAPISPSTVSDTRSGTTSMASPYESDVHLPLQKPYTLQGADTPIEGPNSRSSTIDEFEVTPQEPRFPKRKMIAQLSLCWMFVFYGALWSMLGPTLSLFSSRTGSDIQMLGYLFTIRGLGNVIGGLLGGKLMDRFNGQIGRKIYIIISVAVLAGGVMTSTLFEQFAMAIILNGIAGVAAGFMNVFSNTLVGYLWGDRVGIFLQMLHFCFGVGSVTSPLIVTFVTDKMGVGVNSNRWDALTVCYIITSSLAIPTILFFLFSPALDASRIITQEEKEKMEKRSKDTRSPWIKFKEQLTRQTIIKYIGVVMVALALFVYSEGVFAGLLYTYVTKKGLTDEIGAGLLNSLFWLTFTIGRLCAIFISAKVKSVYMIIIDLCGLLFAITAAVIFHDNLNIFSICVGVLGVSYASMFPATMSLIKSYMGYDLTGTMTSLIILGSSMGNMINPVIITSTMSKFGAIGLLWCTLILLSISFIFYFVIFAFFGKRDSVKEVTVSAVATPVELIEEVV
ncbi:major facilitator superfamily domain-containing protein [Acrasis kona]|uniref:Major facilitator superfamily domain-containing protein n=1 Tax=Acrasis kona TaxID=1008807 RepID=A0AAW2ZB00_9EUKA